jgi:uncharacterized membrane protein (UPF0127 family)
MWNATLRARIARIKSAPSTWWLYIAIGIGLLSIVYIARILVHPATPQLIVGEHRLRLEIADTDAEQARGLSWRASLPRDQGMLFVFASSGNPCFWMKDMRFDLDLIWLDADKRVVGVERGLRPATYPRSFCPSRPVRYVIELNSGGASAMAVSNGMLLDF